MEKSSFRLWAMDEYIFNVDNGYLEGLVRGFRSGILARGDYLNLVQCETVEGQTFLHRFARHTAVSLSLCLCRPEGATAGDGLRKLPAERAESSPRGRDRRETEGASCGGVPTHSEPLSPASQHFSGLCHVRHLSACSCVCLWYQLKYWTVW